MIVVKLLLGLLVSFALGNLLLGLIDRNKTLTLAENIALSGLLGLGGTSLLTFFSSFIYLPQRALVLGGLILLGFAIRQRQFCRDACAQIRQIKVERVNIVWLAIFAVILLKLSYSFVETCSKPEYSWDASGHWTSPGKICYFLDQEGKWIIPRVLVKLGANNSFYPKHIPFLHFWLFSWMGEANDQWSNIFLPVSLVCFLVLFYSCLKKYRGPTEALAFTWLLLSTPFFLYHSTFGYADFTNSLYFSAGIIFFYRWIKEGEAPYFILFALLVAFTSWTKNEGKMEYLLAFVLLLTFLWRDHPGKLIDKLKIVGIYLAAYAVIGWPWQLWISLNRVPSYEQFVFSFDKVMEFHALIYRLLFEQGTWGLFWPFFVAMAAVNFKDFLAKPNRYLLLALVLFYGLVSAIYLAAVTFSWAEAGFNRQWIVFYPVAVFTLGCIMPRFDRFWAWEAAKRRG